MSLRDDLQKEVRNIRARENQLNAELEAREELYQANVRPVMVRAYQYFAEIVENLNIVAPDVTATYPLNPLVEGGVTLKQSQYHFRADNRDNPRQIDIHCKGELEKPQEFFLPTQKSVLAHAELLDKFNFPYHRKNRLDRHYEVRGATFFLEGPMIIHIRIAANPADKNVHINFRNVEWQPIKRYKFAPEIINEEFLERMAQVLIRQIPQLVEQKVDDTLRDQLRNQLGLERDLAARRSANVITRTKGAVVDRLRDALKLPKKR